MSNDIIIFAGPSLAGVSVEEAYEYEFRQPCRQGDIYLATLDQPAAIGIIDGYFEGQPSVWHKEILFALSRGIHVFGASSMGALRAAETHTFGMIGVGTIFEAYRDDHITDDDEVGLVHGPAELGFMPLSEPMVNIRATCSLALDHQVLTKDQGNALCEIAKAMFYKTRTWDMIIEALRSENIKGLHLDKLENWLEERALDQKKIDALEMLQTIGQHDTSRPFIPEFEFVVTEFWHRRTSDWVSVNNPAVLEQGKEDAGGFKLFD